MLIHTDNVESHVAAPIIIENEFLDQRIKLVEDPIQKFIGRAKDEWHVSNKQKLYAKFGIHSFKNEIKKFIKQYNIQLIHAHFANVACLHMEWIHELKIPFVVSFYGYDYEKLPFIKPKYNQLYQRLFELSSYVIVEGIHGRQILIDNYNCPHSKIIVIPIGVDTRHIPVYQRSKNSGELTLLQAATYTEKKGHEYALQAFHKALVECPNMHLTFTGEDWEQGILTNLINYVKRHKIESKVSFLPFTPYRKLHSLLKNYQVLLQPSVYTKNKDCEGGAPIVLLDAMATGMPVIGSDHCDIPNIVIDEQNGWICPSMDIECLSQRIKYTYELDQEKYNHYSNNARSQTLRHYDIINTSKSLERLYESITQQ